MNIAVLFFFFFAPLFSLNEVFALKPIEPTIKFPDEISEKKQTKLKRYFHLTTK